MGNNLVLPVDGQTAWGDLLNAAVNQSDNDALLAQTNLSNHAANSPPDPHGDRSYAQSLVSPITSGVNLANGYVKLNSSGTIPAALVTGLGGPDGMYTAIFDAIATYGMVAGNSDSSVACQSACNAASAAGGGIVWIGPGAFSFSGYVVVPSNVWILMSEGTTINRKSNSAKFLFTNIQFGTNNSPSTNIRITGGKIDATANSLTGACTPIFILQSQHTIIEDVRIFTPFNNPAIELNGSSVAFVRTCRFGGTQTTGSVTTPAVRINATYTNTTPTGLLGSLYNDTVCSSVSVKDCVVDEPNSSTSATYLGVVGSDLIGTGQAGVNFHSGITVGGCLYPNAQAGGSATATSVFSNGLWQDYSVTGNAFPELVNSNDGWQAMSLTNSWTNSGSGPNAQWRMLQVGGGGSALSTILPQVNTIEIIGDVIVGGTTGEFWQCPLSNVNVNTSQIVPVFFTSGSFTPPNGARLFMAQNAPFGMQLSPVDFTGAGGQRVFFHAFLSLSA